MRILLDSHVLVWFVGGDRKCSRAAREAIEAPDAAHVSAATAWELSTKVRLGKWPEATQIIARLEDVMAGYDLLPLSVTIEHSRAAGALFGGHTDPFDRMLAAQTALEQLILVTADPVFTQFGTRTLW